MGNWDLIKGYTGCADADIEPRIAMQIVNEAALCSNRIRRSNYISHQGFELLNGLGFLVTDKQVHNLLDKHTVIEAQSLQETLAVIRSNNGHYKGNLIAIDPHRIVSTSQRIMPKKKKQPEEPARKMLQTFFALDTQTGQPIGCGIGSPGANTTEATIDLLNMVNMVSKNALILADKEHFTEYLIRSIDQNSDFEFLVPAISTERIQKIERSQTYQRKWAGYAIAETMFNFDGHKEKYRLISQREGEITRNYVYKSFLTLSGKPATVLLSEMYQERWSIEDFFNFDGAMGFDRASTFNLNIRYGKMSLALLAQAATYQFRQKLPKPYNRWNSTHLADAVFAKIDGDIRVKDDTIIITCYNAPKELNLHNHYQNLPDKLISEGINPKVPWLYDYKLDFRFK
ncbi:MAG TPA: transposase [Candidatus Methanoperedens sp.]|nr:transposase [Candidatus Methanoperedens sp.]